MINQNALLIDLGIWTGELSLPDISDSDYLIGKIPSNNDKVKNYLASACRRYAVTGRDAGYISKTLIKDIQTALMARGLNQEAPNSQFWLLRSMPLSNTIRTQKNIILCTKTSIQDLLSCLGLRDSISRDIASPWPLLKRKSSSFL